MSHELPLLRDQLQAGELTGVVTSKKDIAGTDKFAVVVTVQVDGEPKLYQDLVDFGGSPEHERTYTFSLDSEGKPIAK